MTEILVREVLQYFSCLYLISPSFLAVADPTFFAAVAVLLPASLNTDFVAEAPLLSLLYLKYKNHFFVDKSGKGSKGKNLWISKHCTQGRKLNKNWFKCKPQIHVLLSVSLYSNLWELRINITSPICEHVHVYQLVIIITSSPWFICEPRKSRLLSIHIFMLLFLFISIACRRCGSFPKSANPLT